MSPLSMRGWWSMGADTPICLNTCWSYSFTSITSPWTPCIKQRQSLHPGHWTVDTLYIKKESLHPRHPAISPLLYGKKYFLQFKFIYNSCIKILLKSDHDYQFYNISSEWIKAHIANEAKTSMLSQSNNKLWVYSPKTLKRVNLFLVILNNIHITHNSFS